MPRAAVTSLLLAMICTLLLATAGQANPLTNADRDWLRSRGPVTVGVVADNEPYSFYRNGRIMGWTVDVLNRIADQAGITMRFRLGSWPEIYGEFRAGGLDAIADISETDERDDFIRFTEPYHLRRTVLFENVDRPVPEPTALESLRTRRIGVVRDIYYLPELRRAGIEPVEYSSYRDLMAALAFGWIDGALAAEMTGNFFARANGFNTLRVAGVPRIAGVGLEDFRLGVLNRPDDPDRLRMFRLLAHALADVPSEEFSAITERWLMSRRDLVGGGSGAPLRLLPEEQEFVRHAPTLTVGFVSEYEPYSFLEQGRGRGFAVELAQDISAATGLVMKPVYDSWSNLLDRFRTGEIDILANMSRTEERSAYTLFSEEYQRIPNAVFLRSGFGAYDGLDTLVGTRVGVIEDVYYADRLGDRLGGVRSYESQEQAFRDLSSGALDAVVMSLSAGNAVIRRLGLINIRIGGEFTMEGVQAEDLRFGVRPGLPYVVSIIDRVMASLPLSRWSELETRWLGPAYTQIGARRSLLTDEERGYLSRHGVVRVCVDPRAPAFAVTGTRDGLTGVAAEVMDRISGLGGFSWQAVPVRDWHGDLVVPDPGEAGCDVLPFALRRSPAPPGWTFTPGFLHLPMAAATRLTGPFVESLREFEGKRVALVVQRSPMDLFERRYPGVIFVPVESEADALTLVEDGTVDAAVGTLAALAQGITLAGLNEVKIAGRLAEEWPAALASRADEPMLGQILTKLSAGIEEAAFEEMVNRQVIIRVEQRVDYELMTELGIGALALIGLFIYWNRKLYALNSQLYVVNRKLREASVTDGLTGLFNRMHFDERSQEDFRLCQRNGWRFSVAMIDVDHFKPVNDQMGHAFGDSCLRHVADRFRARFRRAGDMVARYGGEEFVVFTMGGELDDFLGQLERLRRDIDGAPFVLDGMSRHLTISIGVSSRVPAQGDTLEEALRRADQRLYEAKAAGRNRMIAD